MTPPAPVTALLLLCLVAAPAAALADLAVLTFDPPAGPVERTFAIPNAVENRGDVAAGPFTIGFYLSSDTTFTLADTEIGSRQVPSLAPGAATLLRSTNVTIPASVPAGTYYLAMAVDTGLDVPESNKTNNLRSDPDPVLVPAPPAPDLGSGYLFAYDAAPAGSFRIEGEVGNYGPVGAGPFTLGFYLSGDTAITTADTLLGTYSVPGLAAGATEEFSEYVTAPAWVPGGTYSLGVVIDSGNAVAESNEANNAPCAPGTVTVPETPPAIAWERMLGGTARDDAHSVQQTADGGYVLLGSSLSSASGNVNDTTSGGVYTGDFWLVKTTATGTVQWQNLLGGSREEDGSSVQQTADGGYIAFGSTNSNADGDVSGTNRGSNFPDYWLVKLNAAGVKQWDRVIGGPGPDNGRCVQQTQDGGYILVGDSSSNTGGDVNDTRHGDEDIWVVKVNATGSIQWQNLIGGSSTDRGYSVQQIPDGYILLGSSKSTNGDTTGTHGGFDLWVVKLNSAGAILWQKQLGGGGDEFGYAVRQTSDGGFILLGESQSSANGTVTEANNGPAGSWDMWAVKLTGGGAVEWNRLIGGSADENGRSVRQTADGGYVLLGSSASSESGDVSGTRQGASGTDYWAVKLDGAGAIRWQRLYGGGGNDVGASVQQTADGGYVLAGYSGSSAGGDVAAATHGASDFWLVKLNAAGPAVVPVPPSTLVPTDPGSDGRYEDVNGNGRKDFADVVLFFNSMGWIPGHEPISAFDYNGNGRIDFADVVWLFNHL